MNRWNSALYSTVACAAGAVVVSPVNAQQFQDQTGARFPSPDPLDYTNQVTVGDINGDGFIDIIFANGGGFSSAGAPQQLRIYVNNGAGVFTDESATRAPGMLFLARGAELGDVDGDGDLDIIVAQDFNNQPQLLINNGSGFFTNQTAARLPIVTLGSSRAQFADVDNDGDLDIYLVNGGASRFGTGKGVLFINDGTGVFTDETAARMPNETVIQPMDCIFGDVDGNFTLDLIIASRNNVASMTNGKTYKNNGAGVFTAASHPSEKNNYSYDLGDIDGDGDLDIIGANAHATSTNSELLGRNNGSGTFSSISFPVNAIDDNDSKFFDYDNDGDLDLIIASLGATERIYSNNGTGTFTLQSGVITAVPDSSLDIAVADFDGDGRLDVVTAQGESGSFVNRIYMNVTGPVDTIAPRIVKTEQIANTMNVAGPYQIRAIVYDDMSSDRGFLDKGIMLNYSVNGALAPAQVPMRWVGNSEWRGSIPGQVSGSQISYFVTAKDFADNMGTGSTQNFTILFPPCPADVDGNHVVNVTDLLAIINNWGQVNVIHDVTVQDFSFTPSIVNAKAGDTVKWTWLGGLHTITSGTGCSNDGRFNQALSSGAWQYTVPHNFSGDIPYFCVPHCAFGMTGDITVQPFGADVTGDGVVNVSDLLGVINAWGPCPVN